MQLRARRGDSPDHLNLSRATTDTHGILGNGRRSSRKCSTPTALALAASNSRQPFLDTGDPEGNTFVQRNDKRKNDLCVSGRTKGVYHEGETDSENKLIAVAMARQQQIIASVQLNQRCGLQGYLRIMQDWRLRDMVNCSSMTSIVSCRSHPVEPVLRKASTGDPRSVSVPETLSARSLCQSDTSGRADGIANSPIQHHKLVTDSPLLSLARLISKRELGSKTSDLRMSTLKEAHLQSQVDFPNADRPKPAQRKTESRGAVQYRLKNELPSNNSHETHSSMYERIGRLCHIQTQQNGRETRKNRQGSLKSRYAKSINLVKTFEFCHAIIDRNHFMPADVSQVTDYTFIAEAPQSIMSVLNDDMHIS